MNQGIPTTRTPLIEELVPAPDPWQACRALAELPQLIFFDSALQRDRLGEFSFLTADPFQTFQLQDAKTGDDPFAELKQVWEKHRTEHLVELPPFQGGAAGLLSYELNRCWEDIPPAPRDEFGIPLLAVGLFDWVLSWDHRQNRCWIIAHGIGETSAEERIAQIKSLLSAPPDDAIEIVSENRHDIEHKKPLVHPELKELSSNFSREQYLASAQTVIDYIHAGDIFQANLSQRLLHPLTVSPWRLYDQLRQENRATFAGFMSWDDWTIASASPERFLCLQEREVETRPIKGTRRRGNTPEADLFTRDELRESEKDMAENVMIVDLLRNDLSRVCQPGTVHAPELCIVETYETVQHLVSEIRGTLNPETSPFNLLAATFPGGSITGAPKVRAMEIIAELEPTVRGPYCGSLFYLGFDGWMDSNILIRTFTIRDGWVQCPVGGGIVAQSQPADEYEETLHKAEGMLRALNSVESV